MEVAMAVLSVVGTLASFYGAWVAWKQAGVSRSAAELAGRIKEQQINHRRTSELSELQVHLEYTRRSFLKYGSDEPSSLIGINHSGVNPTDWKNQILGLNAWGESFKPSLSAILGGFK